MTEATQLSLFVPQLDDRIRRVEIEGVLHFSILDVFAYGGSAGSSDNPSKYWARAKRRLIDQGNKLPGLVDWRQDGKGKPTPMGTFKFFLRLVQVVEISEWEPIRAWMADVAHERLEEEANPGLGTARAYRRDLERFERAGLGHHEAAERLRTRIETVDTYKQLSANIQRVNDYKPAIGITVNREYVELFGVVADELREILHTKNIRDALPELQLSYIKVAEMGLNAVLKQKDKMSVEQLMAAVQQVVKPLGEHLRSLCDILGIDPISGKQLALKEGK